VEPLWAALVLGLVEGVTEFLPVSSTGHLILASHLLGQTDDKGKLFDVVIQSGAVLAIVWEYRARFASTLLGLVRGGPARTFALNVAIAFLPLAVLGLAFGKALKAALFNPTAVASAFIVGALVILWAERRTAARVPRVDDVEAMTPLDALKMGLAQAVALVPGMSRSGSTIIGGMLFGFSRRAATEFSFFLAVPTLLVAGAYDVLKHRELLSASDLGPWSVGLVTAFLSAWLCVRWLLRYVSTHTFAPFAWYRIAFGALILVTAHFGWVRWSG
jgi:undecaprenyl-diphosphatase